MKRLLTTLGAVAMLSALPASAQYYQMANQLTQLISPALSGSLNYRGYVEAAGLAGVGENRVNDIGISTTQGFSYTSWFFMGVGAGVDVMMSRLPDYDSETGIPSDFNITTTKAMIPLFSDFRFSIPSNGPTSFFADIKLGAAWLIGSKWLDLSRGYMSNSAQFYLRPSAGIRIPVSAAHPKQAFNIALTYQLITSGNNYVYDYQVHGYGHNNLSLHSLGLTLGFEW